MGEESLSGLPITSAEVVDFFLHKISPPISEEDARKIENLPHWETQKMTPQTLSGVSFWNFDPSDPEHLGQILTDGGKSQKLGEVTERYRENIAQLRNEFPEFVSKIEGIAASLEKGIIMPPLLIVGGRRPIVKPCRWEF